MARKKKSATVEPTRDKIGALPHPYPPSEASAINEGESISFIEGTSITVYRCNTVTHSGTPWHAVIQVQGMLGTMTIKGPTREAVVEESKAKARSMIWLRNYWAHEAVKSEPKTEAKAEAQLTLL